MKRETIAFIMGAASAFAASHFFLHADKETAPEPVLDTAPVAKIQQLVRVDTVYVPIAKADAPKKSEVADIEVVADTAGYRVKIPITQKTYENPNASATSPRYTAWVSGYHPNLDSIRIEMPKQPKPKHWHIGISAGCAVTSRGIQPAVSVGVTYSFFSF